MNNQIIITSLTVCCLFTAACSQNSDAPVEETQNLQAAEAKPVIADKAEIADSTQSKGERVFLRCRSCHTLKEGEQNITGPNLHGIFAAKAGQKPGFAYSDALAAADIIWDEQSFDSWIENPRKMVPGNKMVFAGISKQEDRAALIEYLKVATQ